MAVTKRLNASAKPYHSTGGYVHRSTPPVYTKVYQYPCHFHAASAGSLPFPIVVSSSPCVVPFFVPTAPHPTYSLPPHVFRKPAPVPFSCTTDVHSPPPPPPPPTVPVSVSFSAAPFMPVPAEPAPTSFTFNAATLTPVPTAPVAPGSAPHKIMEAQAQAAAKAQAQAQAAAKAQAQAAAKVQAAEPTTVKPTQEPAPTAGPRPRARDVPLRAQQRTAGIRGRRQQAEPATARAKPARSPSPMFTTRPPSPPLPAPEWFGQPVTTVMIRNIPIKLSPGEMMQLLDDHCARANRNKKRGGGGGGGGGGVLSAYDFLYLRMDFRFRCNMGYAFVNLTTAEATRGLYRELHGCRWKVLASKVIEVCPARIQGRDAQAKHLSGATFACDTDEFLPAIFSPPRDGASVMTSCSPANLKRVGRRDPGLHSPPPPLAGASHRIPPAPVVPLAPPPRQAWRPIHT